MPQIYNELQKALKILNLPPFVSMKEIRDRYIELSKLHHPDINEKDSKMNEINKAYDLLKKYANNFRFTFSKEEVEKQFPESVHAKKFRF